MKIRPLSITLISGLFIVVGGNLLVSGLLKPFKSGGESAFQLLEFWLVALIQLLAVLAGVFMLYGMNWARWLLTVWMGCHIIISIFHTPFELLAHCILFGIVWYFLYRPQASQYFQAAKQDLHTL